MVMVCLQVIGEDSIVASADSQGNFELSAMRPIITNNVTAMSPHIGYDRASAISHKADDEGTTLRKAALALGISARDFDRIVDPQRMVGDPRRDLGVEPSPKDRNCRPGRYSLVRATRGRPHQRDRSGVDVDGVGRLLDLLGGADGGGISVVESCDAAAAVPVALGRLQGRRRDLLGLDLRSRRADC
jgi:hypothetical protein